MCGSICLVAMACAWLGWAVSTSELDGTPFHPPCDLLDPARRRDTEEHAWAVDAYVWAMDCTIMTQARAIPIPGMNIKPMRGPGHLRGLPELQQPARAADLLKCEQHNMLIDWGTSIMGTMFALGNAALEENPDGSWFFEFPDQQRLSEMENVVDWKFDSCALGGALQEGEVEVQRQRIVEAQGRVSSRARR